MAQPNADAASTEVAKRVAARVSELDGIMTNMVFNIIEHMRMYTDSCVVSITSMDVMSYFNKHYQPAGIPIGLAPWCKHPLGQPTWRVNIMHILRAMGYRAELQGSLEVLQGMTGGPCSHIYDVTHTLSGGKGAQSFHLDIYWKNAE